MAFVILAIASCTKNDTPVSPTETNPTDTGTGTDSGSQPGTNTNPYSITENFESGVKTAYAAGDVTLSTGSWYFDDALIGNLSGDAKDGTQSVRLRNGSISMNFDINGVKMLYVKHAKFGSDDNSTWQLMISNNGGSSYTQIGSDISEISTTLKTDSFSISDTLAVRFKILKTGDTRINLDDITFKGIGAPGITVSEPDTTSTGGGGSTSDAAEPRNVTVGSDAPPASGDNSNLLLGNPSDAVNSIVSKDNYLIDFGYYTESYNASRAEPNWVSWHLDASNITHAVSRQDNFAAWADLPSEWFQVQDNSYSGSGFDRGHNCPSADRTSSVDANSATFLMTNMIPQAPNNNQHTWSDLENYLRDEVTNKGYEIYIIMGSYGEGGTGYYGATVATIDNGNIAVPSHIWKIAVMLKTGDNDLGRIDSTTTVLAVNTPNANSIDPDWTKYIVTVRDIEQATGYNFLSELPQAVQDAIETKTYSAN